MSRRPEQNGSSRRWRLRSFLDAGRGLKVLVATQPNAWFHSGASVAALLLAGLLRLSATEWAILVLAIAGVWAAEALNTAVEFVVDLVSPEWNRLAGMAKDVAAGGVLAISIGAAVVGAILFVPKLIALFW